jgi:putative ABC transport system ATP-binding protein
MFKVSDRTKMDRNGHGKKKGLVGVGNGGALLDLRQVEKAYQTPAGDFYALKGIDLQVQPGEFVAIVGKSGAGKSTLINMVTGIDRPTAGQVRVGPHAVHDMSEDRIAAWRGQNVGVIFQFFQLLPMLTCAQNVMLPMDFADLYNTPKERRERALYLLDQVGIPEQADKLPSAVSGGQRQRVAIARALANDPMFLAADEPTGNLDSKTADAVFGVFQKLVDQGKTMLMVTHDRDLASRVSRTVRIADGEIVDDALQAHPGQEVSHV